MAAPRLQPEQRDALLTWLAAEYSESLIAKWFADRKWEPLSSATMSYYRTKWADDIETARKERRSKAINQGLALKDERVLRLCEHADELEAIKWLPDDKGRLWNEKAWRETLDDIAKETGGRRTVIEEMAPITPEQLAQMSDDDLDAYIAKLNKLSARRA